MLVQSEGHTAQTLQGSLSPYDLDTFLPVFVCECIAPIYRQIRWAKGLPVLLRLQKHEIGKMRCLKGRMSFWCETHQCSGQNRWKDKGWTDWTNEVDINASMSVCVCVCVLVIFVQPFLFVFSSTALPNTARSFFLPLGSISPSNFLKPVWSLPAMLWALRFRLILCVCMKSYQVRETTLGHLENTSLPLRGSHRHTAETLFLFTTTFLYQARPVFVPLSALGVNLNTLYLCAEILFTSGDKCPL